MRSSTVAERDVFWLSHHRDDELNRCFRFGNVHVCARCLGTYPLMFAALVAQFAFRAPLQWALDVPWVIACTLPALADWAVGRFRPQSGSNTVRWATGSALGLALGRTLYIHLQTPFPKVLVYQLILVTLVATPVILATYRRSR